MRFIFRMIKNLIALAIILFVVYIALNHAPFLKKQPWNPFSDQNTEQMNNNGAPVPQNGVSYSLEDNEFFQNVPLGQTKNVFQWLNKSEFMSVTGLSEMGYDDEYIVGKRDSQFIVYKFGEDQIRVYATEQEMTQDMENLGHSIEMKPAEAYQK
ncbi:DUF4930 family protein [Staphylococcus massiliensis]|uniref:DUF4930 domain-containing protein n=1 Tax=Staphylococcus massiliensis S46 TaxID=1229783 RepID=K9B5Q3_9STAP|nr:DUF4930 family protein [Staphylococcus massiliensis]EKU50167.1 hypothetical protein C273_00945 [Staphylococcus massiliensis S46]MCG3399092.1 DUF4930 family protein [Staphylococcus massiliensis]MCG3400910.1 DUF4930 family protein [Staphylococcus massiliensis]MCG3412447.1 DUF4930 family protein [Staphylococcus massiliensis]POA01650.1 DUF4930 domain-containing protein [Staphylococcus massiliensis CCUG 55927]